MEVIRLQGQGQCYWQKRRWEVSRALRHQRVGIERIDDRALLYFCQTPIRELHLPTGGSLAIPISLAG